jgi:hypothetical protein
LKIPSFKHRIAERGTELVLTLKDDTFNEVTRELEVDIVDQYNSGDVSWLFSRYKNLTKLVVRHTPYLLNHFDCSKMKELQFYNFYSNSNYINDLVHKCRDTLEILRIK